jgi:hypothetical protein
VVDRLFSGSPDMLLAYLVEDEEIDLERLRTELKEKKKGS